MTAKEYDLNICDFYRKDIESYEKKMYENGITSNASLEWMMLDFNKSFSLIDTVKQLDFSDFHKCMVVLNRKLIASRDKEIEKATKDYLIKAEVLFNFLDKLKDPYYFILHPIYEYKVMHRKDGYIKTHNSGIDNLEIAIEYFKYKINGKK